MLANYKGVWIRERAFNKLFKISLMFSCQERTVIRIFLRGKAPKFDIFAHRFSGRVSLKQNEDNNGFRGVRGLKRSQRGKWPSQSILNKNKDLGRAGARGFSSSIDMLGPPIKKLTLSKTAVFMLNFKLCPPPPPRLTYAWPP